MKKSFILIILGFLLIFLDVFIPLVILQVSALSSIPSDGGVYTSLTQIQIITPIPPTETGTTVRFFIDTPPASTGGTLLSRSSDPSNPESVIWRATISNPSSGPHTFAFRIVWRISMGSEVKDDIVGNFSILLSATLTGKWFINNYEVTSPTQTITVTTNDVTFKFVKSSVDPADSDITCKVTGYGSTPIAIPLKQSSTWEKTMQIPNGTYSLTLSASSSSGAVTMTIYDFNVNGISIPNGDGGVQLGLLSIFGLVSIILGSLIYVKEMK